MLTGQANSEIGCNPHALVGLPWIGLQVMQLSIQHLDVI